MQLLGWPQASAAFFVFGAPAPYITDDTPSTSKTPSSARALASGTTPWRRVETDEINKFLSMCPVRAVAFNRPHDAINGWLSGSLRHPDKL
jgi:hypothetical protein